MTTTDVIARADELRINSVGDEQKARWVFELECRIAEIMGEAEPTWVFPSEEELLLTDRFEGVYLQYLMAMIDMAQGEGEEYVNDKAVFDQYFAEWKAWWIRNHRPAASGNWRVL